MPPQAAAGTIRILLVQHRRSSISRLERLLAYPRGAGSARANVFDVTAAHSLGEALEQLDARQTFDAVLIDVDSSHETAQASLSRLQAAAAHLPVIVLADTDDHEQAFNAIRQGAQDWLPKNELTATLLVRSIRHALARRHNDADLRGQMRRLKLARSKTERQAVELRERARQLDETNRELDDFIYTASHDLKEPLRGIKAYCELFTEDYEARIDADGMSRLSAIMAMCNRLEAQISDLLTFYRVGRVRPAVTQVDLTEVVDGQVAAFRPLLDRRNGIVRVKGPLPAVQGHPVLLGMVFGNLISNGLKYNRADRPVVEIGADQRRPGTIYVRDNGIGIAPEHHESIFDLFRRLHGRKEFEGTGAGLTIVRKIIRGYGGEISLESEVGRGTTFLFTLGPATSEPTRPPHWISLDGQKTPDAAADDFDAADTIRYDFVPPQVQ